MKMKYTFSALNLDDGKILVPIGKESKDYSGVLKVNKEGQEIINLLKDDTTEEEIVHYLSEKYENDEEELAGIVHRTIEHLRAQGLLIG